MTHTGKNDHAAILPDIPLPGHYSVLTLQLNITRYQPTKQARWVLVVREPSEQIELYRGFVNLGEWHEAVDAAVASLKEALGTMKFMQDGFEHLQGGAPPAH